MAAAQATQQPMRVGYRTIGGVRIRYAESDGPADRTVVLTSPWPESVYAFAAIWTRRRPLLSLDALRALLSRTAAGAGGAAAGNPDTCPDLRRPARPSRSAGQRSVPDCAYPPQSLAIVDSGHFVWEEASDEFAALIAVWVTGGYRQLNAPHN